MRSRRRWLLLIVLDGPAHLLAVEQNDQTNRWGLEPLLDVSDLAGYLGVPVSTVYDWRTRGLGPRAYRFGKHLKFALSDVQTWIAQQRDSGSSARR